MAKAFLERDYEAAKAKKAASEQPAEDVTMGEVEVKSEPDQQPRPEPSLPEPEPEQVKKEENRDQRGAVKLEPALISLEEEKGGNQGMAKPSPPAEEKTSQPEKHHKIDLTAPPQPLGPALPGAAEPTEINFEAVLNDTTGGANDFDLNLDFGDDDLGNQNFLGASGSVGGGEGDPGRGPAEAMATDVPGLEGSNTAIGGDVFDMELQRASITDSGLQGQQAGGHGDEGMPGQSSFDDLFMENDSTGEGNLLEGDGLMNLSELDDSWFT